jgi:hypothetical protein
VVAAPFGEAENSQKESTIAFTGNKTDIHECLGVVMRYTRSEPYTEQRSDFI